MQANILLFTSRAMSKITGVLQSNDVFLRVAVKSGGCGGFKYDIAEDTVVLDTDIVCLTDGDVVYVRCDNRIASLLNGSTLDFLEDDFSGKFQIIDNPNATGNCGCGSSFSV
jgi:iron-sulfur cluster assembly accessory protein